MGAILFIFWSWFLIYQGDQGWDMMMNGTGWDSVLGFLRFAGCILLGILSLAVVVVSGEEQKKMNTQKKRGSRLPWILVGVLLDINLSDD